MHLFVHRLVEEDLPFTGMQTKVSFCCDDVLLHIPSLFLLIGCTSCAYSNLCNGCVSSVCVFFLLFDAALPYWNPCIVWDPSAKLSPSHNFVITLSADTSITSLAPIKMTSNASVYTCGFFLYFLDMLLFLSSTD